MTPITTIAAVATYRTCTGLMGTKYPRYSAKIVDVAPSADARTTASSVQPNMNAGNGPKLSSRYAKMPPERGNAPASSAIVSAPNTATQPPTTQQRMTGPGSCSWAATVAGTRNIPLP